jgi:hypothetical protein
MSAVSELPTTRITLPSGVIVRVFIRHDQNCKVNGRGLPVKGATLAQVFGEGDQIVGSGRAYCNLSDNFRRHEGLKHAVARALADAKLTKKDRTAIWQKVLNRHSTPKS